MTARERLQRLRKRTGMSMNDFAKAIGFAGGSSYQRYEQEEPKDGVYPPHLIKRMFENIVGKGNPPIAADEIAKMLFETDENGSAAQNPWAKAYLDFTSQTQFDERWQKDRDTSLGIPIVSFAQVGLYVPKLASKGNILGRLSIPYLNTHPIASQYALQVVGAMRHNPFDYQKFAICNSFSGDPEGLPERILVHLEREENSKIESTIRTLLHTSRGIVLADELTLQPAYELIELSREEDWSKRGLRIAGFVIGIFSPL